MNTKELQKQLKKQKIDYAIILREDPNITYFTEYKDAFCLVVPAKKPAYVISPEMDYERCKKEASIKTVQWKKNVKLFEFIKRRQKGKKIGINFNKITINQQKAMKKMLKGTYKDISKMLDELRTIKTQKEISILKKGCKLTDEIMQKMLKNFKKFKTEKEIEMFLRKEAEKYDGVSFDPIVASGKKASMPHSKPENVPLQKGFCVIDYGIKYKNYCTDITRTVYIGKPTQKEKETYEKVLKTQEECIKLVQIGKNTKEIHAHAYKKLGDKFTHGLGHGIGVEIHELPNISTYSKEKVKKGMIFTIEPGLYDAGKYGIRIEDDILVGNKTEVLTKTNKKLITF